MCPGMAPKRTFLAPNEHAMSLRDFSRFCYEFCLMENNCTKFYQNPTIFIDFRINQSFFGWRHQCHGSQSDVIGTPKGTPLLDRYPRYPRYPTCGVPHTSQSIFGWRQTGLFYQRHGGTDVTSWTWYTLSQSLFEWRHQWKGGSKSRVTSWTWYLWSTTYVDLTWRA